MCVCVCVCVGGKRSCLVKVESKLLGLMLEERLVWGCKGLTHYEKLGFI